MRHAPLSNSPGEAEAGPNKELITIYWLSIGVYRFESSTIKRKTLTKYCIADPEVYNLVINLVKKATWFNAMGGPLRNYEKVRNYLGNFVLFHSLGLCRGIPLRAPRTQGRDSVPESTTSFNLVTFAKPKTSMKASRATGSFGVDLERLWGVPHNLSRSTPKDPVAPPSPSKEGEGGKR